MMGIVMGMHQRSRANAPTRLTVRFVPVAQNLNANARVTADSKMRIEKRVEGLKVDLAVALSMAAGECLRLNL